MNVVVELVYDDGTRQRFNVDAFVADHLETLAHNGAVDRIDPTTGETRRVVAVNRTDR